MLRSRQTRTSSPVQRSFPALLVGIYLVSGACSLVYEITWIAHFSLVFGSTVHGMSVVVAVFFGGLAAGSAWFGLTTTWLRRPVRLYACLEIATGVWALFFPLLLRGGEALYAGLAAVPDSSTAAITLARAAIATAILLPPTFLMGGTLPILLHHLVPASALTRRRAGLVYGANAVGAALGSGLSGFLLLGTLGIARTLTAAALVNVVLGLVALGVDSRCAAGRPALPPSPGPTGTPSGGATSRAAVLVTVAAFGASGFVAMSLEILWLRHLTFFFRDTIYLYTGILTMFVLGAGLGSLAAGLWRVSLPSPVRTLAWVLTGVGVSSLIATYLPIPAAQWLATVNEGSGLVTLAVLALLLGLPTTLMGATFPLVSRIVTGDARRAGRSIGVAYAVNTVGSILGTLAGGFVLFPVFGLQNSLYGLFALEMLAATALLLVARGAGGTLTRMIPAACALLFPLAVTFGLGDTLPRLLIHAQLAPGARLVAFREGSTGTASVVRLASGELQLVDGTVVIGRQKKGGFTVVQGFVPLLVAPEPPRRVLGLAFGAGLSTYAARLFDEVRRLDLVDLSRENVELALAHFPENRGLADDPRVRLVIDDAYSFLKYADTPYDLIFVEPTPPMYSFRNAALYSREFYALARGRLAEGGLFAQILPLANLSSGEGASVMRTFAAVFDNCLLWWNHTDAVMLGSPRPFQLSPAMIERRLIRPAVQRALQDYSTVGFHRLEDFFAGLLLDDAGFRQAAAGGRLYTDDRLGLKFSTGRNRSAGTIDAIRDHLVPMAVLADRLAPGLFSRVDPGVLVRRRARRMALSYSPYPERFIAEFSSYMERYPVSRAADLRLLRRYLAEKGFSGQAPGRP